MPNTAWCSITIGGQLPASKADDLAQAIKDDAPETYTIYDDKLKGKAYLDQFMKDDDGIKVLEIEDNNATGGEMSTVQTFCEDNGLMYSRASGEVGEYEAENVVWDGTKLHHSIATKENESSMTINSILQTMSYIESIFEGGNPKKEASLLVNSEIEKEICIRDYILMYGNPTKWGALRAYLDTRDPTSIQIPAFEILFP